MDNPFERNGDYIGATVNLAARISGAASGGEVLLTADTAALAPVIEGVLYESVGVRHSATSAIRSRWSPLFGTGQPRRTRRSAEIGRSLCLFADARADESYGDRAFVRAVLLAHLGSLASTTVASQDCCKYESVAVSETA